jgi:succinate-semialdehyde dehydrogenase/glutarate-semialdehyde dehydrogenase
VFLSVNPADGSSSEVQAFTDEQLEDALQQAAQAAPGWHATPIEQRSALMRKAAAVLRSNIDAFARMMTLEMGKPIREARAEIEK